MDNYDQPRYLNGLKTAEKRLAKNWGVVNHDVHLPR